MPPGRDLPISSASAVTPFVKGSRRWSRWDPGVRRGIGVFVKAFSFEPLFDNLAYGLGDGLREVEEVLEFGARSKSGSSARHCR